MIDLHTHSSASDGSLSPEDLIRAAKKEGLSAIALTDHDTIAGCAAASAVAQQEGIVFIPGVEIEIPWEPGEFHLLGIGLYRIAPSLEEALRYLEEERHQRNERIVQKMQEMGIPASYEDIRQGIPGPVGRPHFARFLVERRIVKTKEQAFLRYLAKGRVLYVPKGALKLSHAVRCITESGGIPILAHPLSLYVSWGKLPGVLEELKSQGIRGIEAWHPTARVAECERLEKLGKNLGFLITAGSDYHGSSRPERQLGRTAGNRIIDDHWAAPFLPSPAKNS
ncbi:PHP domain-containing protein [Treponema sp. J25]|jgi:predicted metal-dependent phosphoesterase TrpH|uniref:PHP domain-containing protein n=1 Tax=Treponema sp. J25 TaxID=2094121 RepID=UPI0010478273|nr:PHP domain-containing protein [Treponema sp. J25]TCW62372.1 PHP domain-containing protein [Treponema sp. J25]